MIDKILTGLLIGFIGILIGQRVRIGGDASVKRQRFRSFLAVLHAKIDAQSASDFVFSPELRDVSKLEAEALEVRHFIPRRFVHRFDTAVGSYKAARFSHWAGPDQKKQQERDATNDKSKAELISSLDTLHRCAWWVA